MAAEQYKNAEDAYFKLRGQFDTGRLTQDQFDEKLRELMVQDSQGRYWMLGADSGKWYFYDGAKWVQGEPYTGAPPPVAEATAAAALAAKPVNAPAPLPSPAAPPAPPSAVAKENARGIPLVPILLVLLLILLGVAAFFLFQNRDRIFVAQQPQQITPVLPATITRAPSPTALSALASPIPQTVQPATDVPTDVPPTDAPTEPPAPTKLPVTSEPAITVIVVTAEPSPTIEVPTLLPTVTPQPTDTPIPTATRRPATATTAPPTKTATPNFPPNVYVTDIEYASPAKRNQNVAFTATFLNTTGSTQNYNWLILAYDPEKTGNNKGFGESPATQISIPPGESTFTVSYEVVNGPGGCKNLYVRAGWKISPFDKPLFPNTSGDPVTVFLDVCP